MIRFLSLIMIIFVMLVTLASPALAAPPADNPGKGHPEFEKLVFVHYADKFVKKGGGGNNSSGLYSYSGYHWVNSNVAYKINPAGSPVIELDFTNGIQAAFQTWQNDTGSRISFGYQGTTVNSPGLNTPAPDYTNVVGWAYLSDKYPGAIGVTQIWATRGNKTIVDCDTALNTDYFFAWTQANAFGDPNYLVLSQTTAYDVDVQNIMTHEAGHWLQLNDLYSSSANAQTMYGYSADGELKKRSLESGDQAGVKNIYP